MITTVIGQNNQLVKENRALRAQAIATAAKIDVLD